MGMKCRSLLFIPLLSCLVFGAARANWEYSGYYVGDGTYADDGSRFTISLRGGAAIGMGGIKNEIGELNQLYYISPDGGTLYSAAGYLDCTDAGGCEDYVMAGYANLGDLPPTKDFDSFGFAAGASFGWTIPNKPQWRIELGWDHISESEYNASPFLEGDILLTGGANGDTIGSLPAVGTVQSQVTTDIISVMAFYDFYTGIQKPTRTMIPYVGFGVGYADIQTTLNFSDNFGDFSGIYELLPYGTSSQDDPLIQFYRSELDSVNIAALLSLGFSYGVTENMFFDFGARAAYVPRIRWALSNEDGTLHRDWFSAENVIYVNVMLGIRFEF